MTITVALGYIFAPSVFRSTVVSLKTLLCSFLFIPCYARNWKIFPVYSIGWTLNLEMFFYLLFFLALKLSHRYRGCIATGMAGVLIIIGVLLKPQSVILQFWTQAQLSDFIAGIILYRVGEKTESLYLDRRICLAGIAGILIILFAGNYIVGQSLLWPWNMFWGSTLLFLCLPLKDMPVCKGLKYLGDMSYSIYMTHFLVIGMITRIFINNAKINVLNTILVLTAMALAVLCSFVTYRIFEIRIAGWIREKLSGQ